MARAPPGNGRRFRPRNNEITSARPFVIINPKEYPALRDDYQKVATSDEQLLVLTAESSSAGN
jgi:hypothetical protein